VLWGGSFFFNGVAVHQLPPLTLVLSRVTFAALLLLPLLKVYGIEFPRGFSGWKPFFAIGLLNNVLPFSLIVMGQTYISSGLASILNATTPLFTVVVMAIAGEERLHGRRIAGVIAGLIGVMILHGEGLAGFETGQGVGILLCLAAAFSYGLAALVARRLLSNSPVVGTATFQLMASTAMMAVVAGVVDRPLAIADTGCDDLARRDRPSGAVDGAGLHRVLSDRAPFGSDQRHAGDAADSGHRDPAGISGAGRTHFRARNHRRHRDRQRAAVDRRARAEVG
jgi:drug/metabolite transporter (DMT)-like permease